MILNVNIAVNDFLPCKDIVEYWRSEKIMMSHTVCCSQVGHTF